ncbi:MAG TPA: LysR family transcriptional regulator [Chthoniobacterales bacterium]|nr:LysR family transcriptional regulator [Chthoniobacterales bacterium]
MTLNDLNYHHLLYFWAIAKEGSLRLASEVLHVSQPSISAQLKQLEESLGAPLFTRTTRSLVLTDTGQTVLEYAEEIFSLGRELLTAVRQEPGERPLRLHVGVADSVPKIIVRQHLTPVFALGRSVRVICREGSLEELITQLAGHKLDVVLADEPSTSALRVRTFNQRVSTSNVVLCAAPILAKRLVKNFPRSLDGAPAILPVSEMSLRRQLEHWFDSHRVRPRVVAEVEDTALLTDLGAQGLGFVPIYSAVLDEIARSSRFQTIGIVKGLRMEIFAITAQRRLQHPGVAAITAESR